MDYVADFFGGVGGYFKDQWDGIANIYETVKDKGIIDSLKLLYETGKEYINNFSVDDLIDIYNNYNKFNITIDKIIVLIQNDFDVDKMAQAYGYDSAGDWYGRNIAHGIEILASIKLAETFASKYAKKGASGAKIVKNADDVVYNGSSIDKAFSKHGQDFGKYPDGSKTSVNAFTNDVKSLINNGTQVKGTYRTTPGTHVYNPSTKQWAFINADGTFNTAFKLSDSQYKYLIETGVIK